MRKASSFLLLAMTLYVPVAARAASPALGLGVNVPVIGRLTGGGGVLFVTNLDVTNQTGTAAQVDFYFDGIDLATQIPILATGSINGSALGPQGAGTMRAQSNAHFDDFVDALVQAGFLSASVRDDGVLGSALFVFNGATKSGQGAVTARFSNAFGGGTVGVSIKGHEITTNESQSLVAAVRDTRGSGGTQIYPNLFINNIGLTTAGANGGTSVTVQVSAVSNSTGHATGTPLTLTIGTGQTASISQVLNALQVPPGSDDTILVYVKVTSGTSAIEAVISQVDAVTKDGSAFEMSRADF